MTREAERKRKKKAGRGKPQPTRAERKRKTRAMLGDSFAGKALDAVAARRRRMEDMTQ
jgi:hypothetical protein